MESGNNLDTIATITWQAPEQIESARSWAWYVGFVLGSGGLIGFSVWFGGGDPIPPAVMFIVCLGFIIYSHRRPKLQTYVVSEIGINVGQQLYKFSRFMAFSVLTDPPQVHLVFNRRFEFPLTISLPPSEAERISRRLSEFISYNDRVRPHPIDRLLGRLRF